MTESAPEVPSIWDESEPFFGTAEEVDWDALIGEPPDWYYPLVGRVAVATAGLERGLAQVALHLLRWPEDKGGDLNFWLASSPKLRTLLDAAKTLSPSFDILAGQLGAAWAQRNEVVHVSTGWHDWEGPGEPSGWHYNHPRSGKRVYLDDPETMPRLERLLAGIADLDQRVWDLHRSLIKAADAPQRDG